VLVNLHGTFYALDNECSHRGAELSDGRLNARYGEFALECPLHQGCFDIRTGAPLHAPAREAVRTHAVEVDGDIVRIRLGGCETGDTP
jgi:nitrite reductase/ring-hydroxylating ferredoxin subunit